MELRKNLLTRCGGLVAERIRLLMPYERTADGTPLPNRRLARLVGPLMTNDPVVTPPWWAYALMPFRDETVVLAQPFSTPRVTKARLFRTAVHESDFEVQRGARRDVELVLQKTRPVVEVHPYLYVIVPHVIRVAYRVVVGEGKGRAILFRYARSPCLGKQGCVQLPGDYVLADETIPQAMRRVVAMYGVPEASDALSVPPVWLPHRNEPVVTIRINVKVDSCALEEANGRAKKGEALFTCQLRQNLHTASRRLTTLSRVVRAIEGRSAKFDVSEDIEHAVEEL